VETVNERLSQSGVDFIGRENAAFQGVYQTGGSGVISTGECPQLGLGVSPPLRCGFRHIGGYAILDGRLHIFSQDVPEKLKALQTGNV
jgi:hypothetical protein